jgi:hypothetical protein
VFIPTFVMLDQTDGYSKVVVKLLGAPAWLSYREALLALATKSADDNALSLLVQKGDATINFIQKTITEDLNGANVLLLADAINARLSWKWLTNTNMRPNTLVFSKDQWFDTQALSQLRVLRVRHAEHETPEWYAPTEDGAATLTTGVFTVNQHVFASLQGKPGSQANVSPYTSKSEAWSDTKDNVRDSKPDLHAWNPGFYEITAGFLQPTDEPIHWAQLVHSLRAFNVHYTDATALPLPLHLARLMNEYILNIADANGDDE